MWLSCLHFHVGNQFFCVIWIVDTLDSWFNPKFSFNPSILSKLRKRLLLTLPFYNHAIIFIVQEPTTTVGVFLESVYQKLITDWESLSNYTGHHRDFWFGENKKGNGTVNYKTKIYGLQIRGFVIFFSIDYGFENNGNYSICCISVLFTFWNLFVWGMY